MYKNRINYKLLNFLILMGLLYICVTNIGTWFQIISKIVNICLPFIIAFAIAYALHPLEKKLEEKGVRKSLAITFLVIMTFTNYSDLNSRNTSSSLSAINFLYF